MQRFHTFSPVKQLPRVIKLFVSSLLVASPHASYAVRQVSCDFQPGQQIVFLKLDDVTAGSAKGPETETGRRWGRVIGFLNKYRIPAALGVIGDSLESPSNQYLNWISELHDSGLIEFWNHGYQQVFSPQPALGEKREFSGTSSELQYASIHRTQFLAHKHAGLKLSGFGPHDSPIDINTYSQLERFPEIKYVWFYGPLSAGNTSIAVIKRTVDLETPIFHPNFEAFVRQFNKRNRDLDYIALQGHPSAWDDGRFTAFQRIMTWLQNNDVVFCTPTSYLNAKSTHRK